MFVAVDFYRPDLKSVHPGYLNPANVTLIFEASMVEINGVQCSTTAVRTTNMPIPTFVIGSLDNIAARLDRGCE